MADNELPALLKTRLLVGFLGERAQHGWWPTAFYETSGRLFLEPVFSRTVRLAQYHGVLEAARRVHDEHLSVGSYHLFRLPEELEQDLHSMVLRPEVDAFVLDSLHGKDAAQRSLKELAGAASFDGVGPALIGKVGDLDSSDAVEAIAAAYESAFGRTVKTFPYLLARS